MTIAHEIPAFGPHQRLCYYPSSWHTLINTIFTLDCDLFVLSEQRRFPYSAITRKYRPDSPTTLTLLHESAKHLCFQVAHVRRPLKTCWIFFEDNRETVQRLQAAHLRIDVFVGINDGCCEGGNYECVHEAPFMSQVLPLMQHGASYITDHGTDLQRFPGLHPSMRPNGMQGKYLEYVRWPECPGYALVLKGVLVYARDNDPESLYVLGFDARSDNQLWQLKRFRTRVQRGRLAEFRVEVI